MDITWDKIIYLIVGAIIGFLGTVIIEYIKRLWDRSDQKERNRNILKGLEEEIAEGIKRCEGLIKFLQNSKISFSRIYIEFWESTKSELSQNLKNIEVLNLLYEIYYRFDLVNFNMEMNRPGAGAAFAKEYIGEIKRNFEKFKKEILKFNPGAKNHFQDIAPRLFVPFTILAILLSIIFFCLSNNLVQIQNKLNVQAINMTLFISQYNTIITSSEPLPKSFLRSSYENYSLATYGTLPSIEELESIQDESDYLEKLSGNQESMMDKVNFAKDELQKEKDILNKFYYGTFIILIIIQFSLALMSIKKSSLEDTELIENKVRKDKT